MRPINTTTLKLEDHIGIIPQYAILSHTWGSEEVSLQDWDRMQNWPPPLPRRENPREIKVDGEKVKLSYNDWMCLCGNISREPRFGNLKIHKACQQAKKDGLKYLWVDTNCIDKTNSAELSEAINSMYSWYLNSSICYAYLFDVLIPDTASWSTGTLLTKCQGPSFDAFRKSKWFRRGWTLQELLAPKRVCFYSRDWTPIGTKKDMAPLLTEITRVDEKYLLYAEDIRSASIAHRMAAVADRITTRPEDIAYCLLGLFNVNMPLIYGEGTMAFVRLQEEIMKVSDDHSIFAWTWISELTSKTNLQTVLACHGCLSLGYKPNFPLNRVETLLHNPMRRSVTRPTLLAIDPACFFNASTIPILKPSGSLGIFTMMNIGLSISLPIFSHLSNKLFFAVIHNEENSQSDTRTVLAIPLTPQYRNQDRWTRTCFPVSPVTVVFRVRGSAIPKLETVQICRDVQHSSLYLSGFRGTSHRFGFWLLSPQFQGTRHLDFRLEGGHVLGEGIYNNHGVFVDPDESRSSQLIGGLLVFRVEAETQTMWP
ncbi:heterokaryon incompatibility protein-domain-containing protein [Nemania serpens]|nr:heterokaryon incompatibility protein-domain-containing protein [Nemania serpens]